MRQHSVNFQISRKWKNVKAGSTALKHELFLLTVVLLVKSENFYSLVMLHVLRYSKVSG
jgi:hypothetical protein